MKSYDYAHRKGVRPLSWQDFADLSAQLVEKIDPYQPELILGIARAGLFPATAVACGLRCELYPIRLTRRLNDEVVYPEPHWKTPVPEEVSGKMVAVIDEIADTGQTLAVAAAEALRKGARQVVTACLVSHTWASPAPGVTALLTDELVIFPWDVRIYAGGRWQPHPEIEAALRLQGRNPA